VDNDGFHGDEQRTGMIALRAGLHPITVRYFQGTGGASLIGSTAVGRPRQASLARRTRPGLATSGSLHLNIRREIPHHHRAVLAPCRRQARTQIALAGTTLTRRTRIQVQNHGRTKQARHIPRSRPSGIRRQMLA
jgi:hypothetical protein